MARRLELRDEIYRRMRHARQQADFACLERDGLPWWRLLAKIEAANNAVMWRLVEDELRQVLGLEYRLGLVDHMEDTCHA